MRRKLLAAITGFLFFCVSMSSCLGDGPTYSYSPNAIVQAFELDTIHGVNYVFTIDQLTGQIYNQDSLPVGSDTIIDKVLITKLTVSGAVTIRNYDDSQDSIFSIADSVNLVGTMEKPFRFKVWAPDGVYTKEYSLEVRVHQQQGDSLVWGDNAWATNYAPAVTGKQKSVILNNQILVYAANAPVYYSSTTNGKSWGQASATGLPTTELTSLVNFQGALYATVAGSDKSYTSTDGFNWQESALGGNMVIFITPISEIITAIKTFEETASNGTVIQVERFCTTDGDSWVKGDTVPQSFPRSNISATVYTTTIGLQNAMVVGNVINPASTDTVTVAWGYMVGQQWAAMTSESSYNLPKMESPSIFHYGGALYALGESFNTFYKSSTGIVWKKEESMFMLPEEIVGKASDYSMVVDSNNFIWLMRSTPNEVWRGKLNRLDFKVQ